MRVLIDESTNAYLFDAYHAYTNLKARLRDLRKRRDAHVKTGACARADDLGCAGEFDQAERQRRLVRALIHRALTRQGLDQPIRGVLAGGVGFSRAPDAKGQSAEQAVQSLVVRFESKHASPDQWFHWRPLRWFDAGLLGKFGVQPSFDMLKPDDSAKLVNTRTTTQTGPDEFERVVNQQVRLLCPAADSPDADCSLAPPAPPPGFAAQYPNSFVWDVGVRAGAGTPVGELSGFLRYGQTHALPEFKAVKNDAGEPVAATLLGAGSGNRWYREYGGRFVVYRQRANREAHDLGALAPLFEAEGGWRVDRRFEKRSGDFPTETFGDHPERRWFFRLALNGLEVLGGADTPFLVSFAVEWEGKRSPKGLPAGTKIYVQGNLDLNKLLASK